MEQPTEAQMENPNVSTKITYFIHGVVRERNKYGMLISKGREFANKYASMDEAMERFAYWMNQPDTEEVRVIFTVSTSEIVAEWRRGDPNGVSRIENTNDPDTTPSDSGNGNA